MAQKAIVTCSLTGVLTDPKTHPVPVTPEQMAASAREAYDAGACMMHVHIRNQTPGMGRLPSWDPTEAVAVCDAIRQACPGVLINLTTGVVGDDISGPEGCLRATRPEMAALNAGSLNYLRTKKDGTWAWPPMLFDNTVEKIERFAKIMAETNTVPECECFDTGIVRSVGMFQEVGILKSPAHISIIMGVMSGLPAKAEWLELVVKETKPGTHWQLIGIGQEEVWPVHRMAARLGGNLRTGVEDTFYLPDGSRTSGNGQLIEALVKIAREEKREIASPAEARAMLGF